MSRSSGQPRRQPALQSLPSPSDRNAPSQAQGRGQGTGTNAIRHHRPWVAGQWVGHTQLALPTTTGTHGSTHFRIRAFMSRSHEVRALSWPPS